MILQGSQLILIDGDDPTIEPIIRLQHRCSIQLPRLKKLLTLSFNKTPLEVLGIFTDIYGHKDLFYLDTK